MAKATPPNAEKVRADAGAGGEPIKKSTVEARQGRRGGRVLIILAVSLALLGLAYFVLHGYYAGTPHQNVSVPPRPILAATTPVATPTIAPAMMSLSQ
jgi:hypothetical protein